MKPNARRKRRKYGPYPKAPELVRSRIIAIKLSPVEYERLQALAGTAPVSTFMRTAALAATETEDLRKRLETSIAESRAATAEARALVDQLRNKA